MCYAGETHWQQGQGGLRNSRREVKSVQDQIRKGFQEEKKKTWFERADCAEMNQWENNKEKVKGKT